MKDITEVLSQNLPAWYCKQCGYVTGSRQALSHMIELNGEVSISIRADLFERMESEFILNDYEIDKYSCENCKSESTIKLDNIKDIDSLRVIANAIHNFFPYSARGEGMSNYLEYLGKFIRSATHFIHFSTLNIDDKIFDLLLSRSSEVSIKGIIGANGNCFASEKQYPGLAFENKCKNKENETRYYYNIDKFVERYNSENVDIAYGAESNLSSHAKYIIVDGVSCITGSANLSRSHWEKEASEDFREYVEGSGNIDKVMRINNEYFVKKFAHRKRQHVKP